MVMLLPAGHYVSLIKSKNTWLYFDDDTVDIIPESTVAATFGNTQVGYKGMAQLHSSCHDMLAVSSPMLDHTPSLFERVACARVRQAGTCIYAEAPLGHSMPPNAVLLQPLCRFALVFTGIQPTHGPWLHPVL